MGATKLKTVAVDAAGNKPKEDPARPEGGIAVELRVLSLRRLGRHMQDMFAVLDDQLFDMSGLAKSNDDQARYFEAMRYLRLEANAIRARYEAALLSGYDAACRSATPRSSGDGLAFRLDRPDGEDLALVEEDALEEDLAVSAMVGKAKDLYHRELHAWNARLAHLSGRDGVPLDETPFGPSALCRALVGALRPLDLELPVRLLIYKLYERAALAGLGEWYRELNARLLDAGILPNLSPVHPQAPRMSRPPPAARANPGATAVGFDDSHALYMEAFAAMENLLGRWRARMGLPGGYPADFAGPAFAPAEVLNALSVLQHPAMLDVSATADGLKPHLRRQLGGARPDAEARPLARREEDLIDMVSLLFECILADHGLPGPVRTLISRLQIPVVKVAILERSLFGRKNHPVRLLLNALARAGIGLDADESVTETPVFKRIEAVVNRILDEFDQNVALFSELLDEFSAFMQREDQRSGMAEERARQAVQSKEQLQLAKHKVAYEIALRLQGRTTPAAVRSFLFNEWKDVLVLGYLRRDKAPRDWENSLAVMDRLVWSVTVPVDASTRTEVVDAILPLYRAIKTGLETLSLDPGAVATVLGELRACHIARLPRTAESDPVGRKALDPAPGRVEIRDPELARAISDIRASLPDVENFGIADLAGPPMKAKERLPAVDEVALALARHLDIGEWIELDEGGRRVRAKLAWKSRLTTAYVFVNRKGGKLAEIPQLELARRLAEGSARVIEGSAVPLMDRALHGLLGKLRGPVGHEELLAEAV